MNQDDYDWYIVTGVNPEPWQASEGSVGRKGGKTFVQFHKPPQFKMYQEALKEEFPRQNPNCHIYTGFLELVFFFWRQLAEFEIDSKTSRAHVADTTNLQKSTEDALQKILYVNDRDNRCVTSIMVSQSKNIEPCIIVGIREYPVAELVFPTILRAVIQPESLEIPREQREHTDVF